MRLKTVKRALAAVLGGCMLISGVSVPVKAEEPAQTKQLKAEFSEATAGHESTLTLTGDSNLNGEKEVEISEYLPEREYVKDGLVLQLDGIDNAGPGTHDSQSEYWVDLSDSTGETQITINREGKESSEGINGFTEDAFHLNNSKVYLPDKVAQAINGEAYTVEFVVDSEGYMGYQRSFSPILTVEEMEDAWSVFVRTPGKTAELKQHGDANAKRLQTAFENVVDTTSAITIQKDQESAWYANGEKKNSYIPTWSDTALARQIILGGRLKDSGGNDSESYVTNASYHAIRIYNRVLSEKELRQNAKLDQARYYGQNTEVPNVIINGTSLSGQGKTTITAEFQDGVAQVPVESTDAGTVAMKFTVDEASAEATLVTRDVLEQTVVAVPDALNLTNVSVTTTPSVLREMIKNEIEEALKDSYFVQDGGSIHVSGTVSPFNVELVLGDQSKTKSVAVTMEYQDSSDMDVLKQNMQKVLQGEFSFDSEKEVTAEALQQQVQQKVEEDITATVAWSEGKKCYEMTLARGEETITSPLYVNSEVSISEFTEELLQDCTIRKNDSTTVDVKDGALCMSATQSMTYENVVLPVFNYGRNYMMSVDLKITGAVDSSRWAALSYGVQLDAEVGNNDWTFWQMAIRQNATLSNGVECANKPAGGGNWSVPVTASYTEALRPDQTYNLKVVVKGKKVYEYVNDRLMIKYDAQNQMKYGKVAFTIDRLNAEYSNLVVTGEIPEDLLVENPMAENGYDTKIFEPETSLAMVPAVLSENDGKSVSELISGTRRPSTIIRTVSENMTVTDNNEEISLAEYVARADKKALVGFRIESMEVANAFAAYVQENQLVDIMVIAESPEVLLAACNRMAGVHGMLDCSKYTDTNMFELVSKTNEANSRIVVLPQQLASEENIQYIQDRAIAVWVKAEKDQTLNMILNGAEGILTEDFESAYDVIEAFDEETPVLTRDTIITAHRGLHQTAPENSERSAKLAVEYGANAIECDVVLSKDGEVVINHDDTTGRLMNQNLVVANSTLEELQALTFNTNAEPGDKMPTLQELFLAADEADPDDDIIHVIEIKTGDSRVIEPMVKIIKDMNMEDRVIFISFHDAQLDLVRQAMPNVAVGELNSVCSAADDVATAMKKLSDRMDRYGYFYNCSSGAQNEDILKAARFRGIYVHPWTVNGQDTFETEFINDYHGITTDRTDFAKDYLNAVETGSDTYTLAAEDPSGVAVDVKAYTRMGVKLEGANIVMKQISGTKVNYANGVCTAEEPGEAEVLFGATYQLPATGKTYTVYSTKPVTLTIEEASEVKLPVATVMDVDFTGGDAFDKSEMQNAYKTQGTPVIEESEELHKNVAHFDGKSAYIYPFDEAKYDKIKDAVTIECMFKYDSIPATGEYEMFSNQQSGGIGLGVDNGRIVFYARKGNVYCVPTASVQEGRWFHVVGVVEQNAVKLYVNGELIETIEDSNELNYPANPASQYFVIGGDSGSGENATLLSQGSVSIARLYDKALSAEEIALLNDKAFEGADLPEPKTQQVNVEIVSSKTAPSGGEMNVDLHVNATEMGMVDKVTYEFNYDPNLLTYTGVQYSKVSIDDSTAGILKVTYKGIPATADISQYSSTRNARLNFKINETAEDVKTALVIKDFQAYVGSEDVTDKMDMPQAEKTVIICAKNSLDLNKDGVVGAGDVALAETQEQKESIASAAAIYPYKHAVVLTTDGGGSVWDPKSIYYTIDNNILPRRTSDPEIMKKRTNDYAMTLFNLNYSRKNSIRG